MSDLPPEVVRALKLRADRRSQPTDVHVPSSRIARGDLRIVHALSHMPTDPRIGLVLAVDPDNEFTDVLLVHTATELACDSDGVIPHWVSSAPYDVVVETDLRAVVWTWQLGASIGSLDDRALEAIRSIAARSRQESGGSAAGTEVGGVHSGLRLAGPADPRWSFKEAEGHALRRLSEDCTTALLNRGLVWQVDPGLLRPGLLDQVGASSDVLDELLHWVMTRKLTLTEVDLEELELVGGLDLDTWHAIGDLGLDVWTALQHVLVDAASGESRRTPSGRCLLTAAHLTAGERTSFEIVHVLGLQAEARA
jgi:hypothetical protein